VQVTVFVGDSVLRQQNPLFFTRAYAGGNPLPQVISVASTGVNFGYSATTVSATPDPSLASGTYFAAIILKSQDGNTAAVVPATLTVAPASAAFLMRSPAP